MPSHKQNKTRMGGLSFELINFTATGLFGAEIRERTNNAAWLHVNGFGRIGFAFCERLALAFVRSFVRSFARLL